jgi:hypothetical protein
MDDKDVETAKKRNREFAKNRLLELLKICPQVIPPSIGIEAYLKLLDEGADLMLEKGYVEKQYKVG